MDDDWNLKGRKKIIIEHREYGEFAGFKLLEEFDGDVYKVEDIEILRKKLIEDIKKLKIFDEDEFYNEDVIRIINKRFGVE